MNNSMIKLQLVNLYGLNVYRNLKDPKEKRKKFWLGVAYVFGIMVMMCYVGAMSFGYVSIGLAEILPAYLIMLTSIIILMFSIFKAGAIIFQRKSYDMISSLPVKNSMIVFSRFLRLYIENILLAMAVMLPAMMVFGVLMKPSWTFYAIGIMVTAFIPFLPIAISVFVGTIIIAVSSRAKHKNLVSILLSMALVVGIMVGSMQMSTIAEEIDMEALKNILNVVLDFIRRIYPPAVWLGDAMLTGDFLSCFGCVCGGLFILGSVIGIVSMNYTWICRGIFRTGAKHDYQMEKLERSQMLKALYRREFKRYFASSIYVTNTIVSPIMGTLFAVSMFFVTPEQLESGAAEFYAASGMTLQIRSMLPLVLAAIFCMMPITAVSISIEGKQWWLIKTLPIPTKNLLDGKLLMNLTVVFPFYVLSAILVSIAQKVTLAELIWILLVPLMAILFSCVFGLAVNLKMPVFDWENEVTVVKQSASAFVGGIVPFFVMLSVTFGVMIIPAEYTNLVMALLCLGLGSATFILYRKNSRVDLLRI